MTPPRPRRRTLLAAAAGAAVAGAASRVSLASSDGPGFETLPGWGDGAFTAAATALTRYAPFDQALARTDFEAAFRVLPMGEPAHVTAYYEPVLEARAAREPGFSVPVLGMPPGSAPFPSRGEIMAGALEGVAPVLYWLADPVDLYFLQIQGSGRLSLPDGRLVRLGYGGRNGHRYSSIGRIMRERGILGPNGDGLGVKAWLRANPTRGAAIMAENRSYVFFTERQGLDPALGPVGAMGEALPAGHAVAIDTEHHAYGDLFWLSHPMPDGTPSARLVMAMDT
ncbi:MAG: MltA domain-containing protein, partial [Pseudomonadota bacterium]